jgi:hypothetical protein
VKFFFAGKAFRVIIRKLYFQTDAFLTLFLSYWSKGKLPKSPTRYRHSIKATMAAVVTLSCLSLHGWFFCHPYGLVVISAIRKKRT